MKTISPLFILPALALTVLLPAHRIQSQALPPTDPLAAVQAMSTADDDLIKRQEATLKDLSDMTDTAREVRIFSKRG